MLPPTKTVKDPRELLRSTKLNVLVYPYDLPFPYGLEIGKPINPQYTHRLAEKIANVTQVSYVPNVYANVHDKDIILRGDLDCEQEKILWVYEALRKDTQDLDFALYYCGNPMLRTAQAKFDSLHLNPNSFYLKYRYYTEEGVGQLKKLHINIILNYTNGKTKFFLRTVFKKLFDVFGNGNGQLRGIKPYITGSTLAHDVRYLCHLDNPEKFQYDPNDIICINCNNAKDIILSGAPIGEKANMNEAIIQIARECGLETTTDLLMYLKTVDANIYHYANTPQGLKIVSLATRDNYHKHCNQLNYKGQLVNDISEIKNALWTIANKQK